MSSPRETSWSELTNKKLDETVSSIAAMYADKPLPPLPVPLTPDDRLIINDDIDKYTLSEVALRLGDTFNHIPFAISGTAALALDPSHEFSLPITHVSIITPPECVRAIKCWATACGLQSVASVPCGFGIKASNGKVCLVHIKKCTETFSSLDVRYIGNYSAPVLTLKSVANRIAKCYMTEVNFSDGTSPAAAKESEARQLRYASHMRWVLRKMGSRNSKFRRDKLPAWIIDPRFWVPFTASFPDTLPLFAKTGILVEDGEVSMTAYSLSKPSVEVNQLKFVNKVGKVSDSSLQDRDAMGVLSAKILGIRLLQAKAARETEQDKMDMEMDKDARHQNRSNHAPPDPPRAVPQFLSPRTERTHELLEHFGVPPKSRSTFHQTR